MRVLLTSHGSTGDIYPVIRLGRALLDAGHSVRFATVNIFREEIEAAGIEFVYLPPDWDLSGFAEAMRDLTKAKNPLDLLRIIYSESVPYLDQILETLLDELQFADIFVTSYVFANLCQLARKAGVPCAVTTFAHNIVPSDSYPPDGLPRLFGMPSPIQRPWNRALWGITDRVLCWQINKVVGAHMERHGMGRSESYALAPADRVLVTVSKLLFEPKRVWNDTFRFCGYLRWQSPENGKLDEELAEFTGGERVPILTFGSVTFDESRKVMSRFMRNWPHGKKIIIQAGWAGLTIERPDDKMKCIGRVSHDQLFKHGSCVIHHGGAGTTASVLHAGIPQVIIPHIGDQWFFAREVQRLCVGLELKCKKWPEQLLKAVKIIERSDRMQENAKEVASLLNREDGPRTAVHELESLLEESKIWVESVES